MHRTPAPVTIRAVPGSGSPSSLVRIERYYDAAPRASARTQAAGPFTLFISTGEFPYYARPCLGLASAIEPDDVTSVRELQRGLGVPESIEWVVETTPSLSTAARAAGMRVLELPLLILDGVVAAPAPAGVRIRRVPADEPDLDRIMAVASVAFAHAGTAAGPAGPVQRDDLAAAAGHDRSRFRERLAAGATVLVVAEDRAGPIASGAHQPVDGVTEVVGVATLPSARRRGIGAAVTGALVHDAIASGLDLVFLSAAGDDVARIYERLGFRRAATAGIAQVEDAPSTGT